MARWRSYEQATAELSSLPAGERLQVLITEWTTEAESLSGEEVRRLFVTTWPDARGSVEDHSHELLSMLRWIAPVRDVETYLVGTLTIFRAAPHDRGISWTLDEATATAAASGGATPLFRATIASSDVLGHFTGNGTNEVLVDPQDLGSVERI